MRASRRLGCLTKFTGLVATTLAATALVPLTSGTAQAAATAFSASCPTRGTISQGYTSSHDGVDIANSVGTPIHAAGPGTVINAGTAAGYGLWIRIRHTDGTVTEYGHMDSISVSVGQSVSGGQYIAAMGNRGQTTGPHLHFETHLSATTTTGTNTFTYMSARGVDLERCVGGGNPSPTNFTTWGTNINVRADARLNASVVRVLPGPTAVRVTCQKKGDTVVAEGYTNDLWAYIPALGGYVSNIYIDHPAAELPGIGRC
ncbi:M23 family metallopeptidase [Streptomyces tsukubensis]|uniref:M23 family metallopeptidase n=1 Tax=Streptomyces tsukubensis TaxID=83656 RepID=UPI00344C155F